MSMTTHNSSSSFPKSIVVEAYRLDEYDNRKTKTSPDCNGCPSGDALLYRVTSKKLKAYSLFCFYKSKVIYL